MKKIKLVGSAAVGLMVAAGSVYGFGNDIIEVDLTGWQSWGGQGSANNTSVVIDLSDNPEAQFISGIGWEMTIASIGESWNSDVQFDINGEVIFRPGTGTTGTASYSSGGIIKLVDAGLEQIDLFPDQLVTIEVFETFDDPNNTDTGLIQDANISGTLFLQIYREPAPGGLAVLAIAGLVGVGGRRRRD